jgi:hypothetical protein
VIDIGCWLMTDAAQWFASEHKVADLAPLRTVTSLVSRATLAFPLLFMSWTVAATCYYLVASELAAWKSESPWHG